MPDALMTIAAPFFMAVMASNLLMSAGLLLLFVVLLKRFHAEYRRNSLESRTGLNTNMDFLLELAHKQSNILFWIMATTVALVVTGIAFQGRLRRLPLMIEILANT